MWRRLLVLPAVLFIIVFFVMVWHWLDFIYSPMFAGSARQCIIIPRGDTARQLAIRLENAGGQFSSFWLFSYLRLTGKGTELHAGQYCFHSGESSLEVIDAIAEGRVAVYSFTLIDGWTYAQLMDVISQTSYLKQTSLENQVDSWLLGHQHTKSEGLFLPNTYYVHYGTSVTQLLRRARAAMEAVLKKAWEERAENLPYHRPYQALIAASIIEKESANPQDRFLISSVIVNRLNKRMYLQMDPTVMYGLNSHSSLTHSDLKKNTPYNTYRHIGLPPTPICMPGKEAIIAALHPAESDYLYFVSRGDGSHQFSKTLKEQNQAVKHYILSSAKHEESASKLQT